MKKITLFQKIIIVVDVLFLWNMTWFFNVSSTAMNYTGVAIIIALIYATINAFREKDKKAVES
jgi:hypothetical protein